MASHRVWFFLFDEDRDLQSILLGSFDNVLDAEGLGEDQQRVVHLDEANEFLPDEIPQQNVVVDARELLIFLL